MACFVVDVYPKQTSLESMRGILLGEVLVLPDPLAIGQALVRYCATLSPEVMIVRIEEVEMPPEGSSACDDALKNHVYTVSWLSTYFTEVLSRASTSKVIGS